MATPRWEGDTVGVGVGDAGELAPGVRHLLEEMVLPHWVTEDPREHLLGALTSELAAPGSTLRFLEDVVSNAVYLVTLAWERKDGTLQELRRDVLAVVGAIAHPSTHVHQRVVADRIEFDVVTGTLEGESRFRTHGFMLRFRIVGEPARRLAFALQRESAE